MKKYILILLAISLVGQARADAAEQDSTGLPGDNFSLEAALDLFKRSADLESFETALNMKDQKVNNLDLDGNGKVDYIRVTDHSEGDAHAIILQIPMGKGEAQDVAVIELERTATNTAMVQIRGSEELYGKDVIFEPFQETDVDSKGGQGPSPMVDIPYVRVWVNVWSWPCVGYMYGPYYSAWNSPWYWSYYPPWWSPWSPFGYNTYWGWHSHYHQWYQPTYVCRTQNANVIYGHRSSHSPHIRNSTASIRQQRDAGLPQRITGAGSNSTRPMTGTISPERNAPSNVDTPTRAADPGTKQPVRTQPEKPTRTTPDKDRPAQPAPKPVRTKPTPSKAPSPSRTTTPQRSPGRATPTPQRAPTRSPR